MMVAVLIILVHFLIGVAIVTNVSHFIPQALCGSTVKVPTLDGQTVTVTTQDVVRPGMRKPMSGEGLPLPKCPERRGDLVVEYEIKFPDQLNQSTRETLKRVLPA